jgi:hypothetical protein
MADIEPSVSPNLQRPKAGFTAYAERLNGAQPWWGSFW